MRAAFIVVFLTACGAPNWTAPRTAVPIGSDEAAAAHACRYSHVVRELGVVPGPADPPVYVANGYGEELRIEVRSGASTYVVCSVVSPGDARNRRGEPARRWEITDGTSTVHAGEDVHDGMRPEVLSDGAGAIVLAFFDSGDFRFHFVLIDGGRVARRGNLPSRDVFELERTDGGWLLFHDDGRTDGMVMLALGSDGSSREIARVGDQDGAVRSVIARTSHGGFAVAYAQGRTVRFAAHTREGRGRAIEVDADEHWGPRPIDLLAVEDGWWLVIGGNWRRHHYSWAAPEWRFVHLDLRGRPTARAQVRFDEWREYAGELRVEDGELRARFTGRGGEPPPDVAVAIVPRGPCPRAPFAPCDPRRWPGPEPTPWRWDRDYRSDELSLERHAADGELLWTTALPHPHRLSAPLVIGERVHVITRAGQVAHLLTLDGENGRLLADVELRQRAIGRRERGSACIAERNGEPLIGLATRGGLSVHDAHGARLHAIEGAWSECELVVLPDRVVLAAARVDSETSGGPMTSIEVFVLSGDGRALVVNHTPGTSGRNIHSYVDQEGVALVWSNMVGWERTLWRLDREGRPRGAPRHLATLYHFPRQHIEDTPLGPSLLWSTADEHGVVPLCHADAADDAQ